MHGGGEGQWPSWRFRRRGQAIRDRHGRIARSATYLAGPALTAFTAGHSCMQQLRLRDFLEISPSRRLLSWAHVAQCQTDGADCCLALWQASLQAEVRGVCDVQHTWCGSMMGGWTVVLAALLALNGASALSGGPYYGDVRPTCCLVKVFVFQPRCSACQACHFHACVTLST